jgi:pimeloyl-ACP methyl ester carboxylesterase
MTQSETAMTFPAPHFVETNGLTMAVYEQGQGPAVVLCHGFPELAFAWRHQLPALAGAGFRAIAPDQRGYGATGGPKGPDAVPLYDMAHLTGDLVGLLDALGLDRAVFCGHDWGGLVVWQMALMHPTRVAGVIGVNTPFLPRPPDDPIQRFRQVFGDEMYIVEFQRHGAAERVLEADIAKSMRFWYRKSRMKLADYDKLPPEYKRLALIRTFEQPEARWSADLVMSAEELEVYIRAFTGTGYEGGINWYRNMTRNWHMSADLAQHIAVPCLMISAADDVVLRPDMTQGMERYIPDLEKHVIADCGHWTQSEQPEELNRLMVDWLARRFG